MTQSIAIRFEKIKSQIKSCYILIESNLASYKLNQNSNKIFVSLKLRFKSKCDWDLPVTGMYKL